MVVDIYDYERVGRLLALGGSIAEIKSQYDIVSIEYVDLQSENFLCFIVITKPIPQANSTACFFIDFLCSSSIISTKEVTVMNLNDRDDYLYVWCVFFVALYIVLSLLIGICMRRLLPPLSCWPSLDFGPS